jgi:hypothetical protein
MFFHLSCVHNIIHLNNFKTLSIIEHKCHHLLHHVICRMIIGPCFMVFMLIMFLNYEWTNFGVNVCETCLVWTRVFDLSNVWRYLISFICFEISFLVGSKRSLFFKRMQAQRHMKGYVISCVTRRVFIVWCLVVYNKCCRCYYDMKQ